MGVYNFRNGSDPTSNIHDLNNVNWATDPTVVAIIGTIGVDATAEAASVVTEAQAGEYTVTTTSEATSFIFSFSPTRQSLVPLPPA